MESSKRDLEVFWHSYIPQILSLNPFSNSWIVHKRSFMNISWHQISIQTLFKTCFPTSQDGYRNHVEAHLDFM